MQVTNTTTKDDLHKRLRRIAGQVRGVEKMLVDERDCLEILQQLAAIKSAVQQTSQIVARAYACQRLQTLEQGESQQDVVEDLISVVSKAG